MSAADPAPRAWLGHAVVSVVTTLTFARALPYPLHPSWDDGRFIVDNPDVHEVSLRAFASIVGKPHFEAYHPLHLLSYWLDVPWFGSNALALHATSLTLWVITANVLLSVFRRLGLSQPAAILAALACTAHPIQVEAVSWATGRKDVLALLFASACIWWHLRSERFGDASAWLSRASFACAALSKTTTLPLPIVLVLIDTLLRRRPLRRALLQQLPSMGLSALLATGVFFLWRSAQMLRPNAGDTIVTRVLTTLGHQTSTALWPSSTSPMYSTAPLASVPIQAWIIGALLLGLLLVAYRMHALRALFALGAFLLLLVPVSNAVPMYFPFQDRYLSLPIFGLAFGFGAGIDALCAANRTRWPIALGAVLVMDLAARTAQYQSVWQSESRLWEHAAHTQPDAFYAFMQLGGVRRRAGDHYGSIRAYQELLRVDPSRNVAHAGLLQAVALRDEALRGLSPSRAESYAKTYYNALEDPDALRTLAQDLLRNGYLRAFELPLARALSLRPVPDATLEHAAALHFAQSRPSVGLFYLEQMKSETIDLQLRSMAERTRAQMANAPKLVGGAAQRPDSS